MTDLKIYSLAVPILPALEKKNTPREFRVSRRRQTKKKKIRLLKKQCHTHAHSLSQWVARAFICTVVSYTMNRTSLPQWYP